MNRSLFLVLILLGLSVAAVKAAPLSPQASYTIGVPSGLDTLRVRTCLEAGGTFDLEPDHRPSVCSAVLRVSMV